MFAQISATLFDFVRSLFNNHHFSIQGCLLKVQTLLLDNLPIILVVLTILLTLEIVVVVLAVCLCLLQNHRKDVLTHQVVLRRGRGGEDGRYQGQGDGYQNRDNGNGYK